ncbi:hypothetical protein ACHAXS_002112 [Conticribra weissflogii]
MIPSVANSTSNSNSTSPSNPSNNQPNRLEVLLLLESPGGAVSPYGLAASHLRRLRSTPGVTLTVCVDAVAASGGYMMACQSSPGKLYCAPFAMVGSIGVVGQSLNLQKTLEGYGVRSYVFRGGTRKQPVGMLGEVTKEGRKAVQEAVDGIHTAFRDWVVEARKEALADKNAVIDRVADGDVFLGTQAIALGLVDRLVTSDEYIAERIRDGARVLKLVVHARPVGLAGWLSGPSRGRSPSVGCGGGLPCSGRDGWGGIWKRIVGQFASSPWAWADPSSGVGFGDVRSSPPVAAFCDTGCQAHVRMSFDGEGL